MNRHLKALAGMLLGNGGLGMANLRQLLRISVLASVVTGCGPPIGLDVLVYDTCIARHPKDATLCEGPRQAYELEPTAYQARAAGINPPTDSSYEGRSTVAQPVLTPMPLHPSPTVSGRNG